MDRSIGWVATAPHVVQTATIFYLAITQLPQRLFSASGTATTAAIQRNAGIMIRSKSGDTVSNLVERNIDRLPDMRLLVFVGGAHINDQWLTGNGWVAGFGQNHVATQYRRQKPCCIQFFHGYHLLVEIRIGTEPL